MAKTSLKKKYIWVQGFSAAVSIGVIGLLFYFCSHGFENLVRTSAKNLNALYTTGELKSLLWKERSELNGYLQNKIPYADFSKTSEIVSALASALATNSEAEIRNSIGEFVRIHDEMRATVRPNSSTAEVIFAAAQPYYDREYAILSDASENLLLGTQEKQAISIHNATLVMKISVCAAIVFSGLIFLASFLYLRKFVINPIMTIASASLKIAQGEYVQIRGVESRDEIGVLARNFNQMVEEIRRTSVELIELNRVLEAKVEQRTALLLETEGKLVTAAKMSALGEMAGGVAHEINTPLATIELVTDQLRELVGEDPLDLEMIGSMAGTIAQTVRRISLIVKGLRTFSRDGSQEPFTPTPLRQIVEETLLLCGEKLKRGNIELRIDPIADDLLINCQSVQISQVLLNLVNNACDAIRALPDRWIRIDVERNGDRVRVSVTDSGHGIAETVRAKLFQPFFTTKEIGKGTGLGLSISKGIIAVHGGTIELDPHSENTRFLIELPKAG